MKTATGKETFMRTTVNLVTTIKGMVITWRDTQTAFLLFSELTFVVWEDPLHQSGHDVGGEQQQTLQYCYSVIQEF